jgi:CheY-like chemotaxis protein
MTSTRLLLIDDDVRLAAMVVDYLKAAGYTLDHVSDGEQALTQTLQRLSRPQDRALVFLDGHGERKPQGVANHDLGAFGRELEKIGIQARSLHLAKEPQIPADTAALVIASPQTPLSPDEVAKRLQRSEARLRFADEAEARPLKTGDYIDIAPHRRHRVDEVDLRAFDRFTRTN